MNVCVADNIKKIIEVKGMKQVIVAERSGFTANQFCDMLNGRKVIRAEYIPRIANALNCELNDLFATMAESKH